MTNEQRGFASMDPNKQRELARQGGKAAHVKGTAHEWNREQAREVGRKGRHREPPEAGASGDGSSVGCTKGTVRD